MKTVINWLTERSFSYLELVVFIVVITSTEHLPYWITLLVIVAAAAVVTFVNGFLRGIAHLPSQKRARE